MSTAKRDARCSSQFTRPRDRLSLAAREKSVQMIYERTLRPVEKMHAPWVERINGQLIVAYAALEAELTRAPIAQTRETINQAGITTAVAWHFTQRTLPETLALARFPRLLAFSEAVEKLPEFIAAPYGDSVYRAVQ